MLFIPSGTKYLTENSEPCTGIGILFSFTGDLRVREGIYAGWSDPRGDYQRLFERLDDSLISRPKAVLHHTSLLLRILDRMSSEVSRSERYASMLEPAVSLIKDKFRENLPIKAYSDVCNLSESYFRRIFGEQLGMSPIEYRNMLRFEEVRRLRHQGLSVNEIAETCGFCDAAYLRRLFKRETGGSVKTCTEPEIV